MVRQRVAREDLTSDSLVLADEEARHLVSVLRVKVGSEVSCFDGVGATRLYGVAEVGKRSVTLVAKTGLYRHEEARTWMVLFACVSKGDRMTWTIEKAVELGVTLIVPVLSERSVVRLDAKEAVAKQERWQRVADDAARQCGAVRVPEVHVPVALKDTVALMASCEELFVAALIPQAKDLWSTLEGVRGSLEAGVVTFGWWTGPEGDFTPAEMDLILKAGAKPVTLGPLILRAETAAMYGMAVLGCFAQSVSCGATGKDVGNG